MFTEQHRQRRGKALTEAFFHRMDRELIADIGKRLDREAKLSAFEATTGIRDPKVIGKFVDAGFNLKTLTAFFWAPAVLVAYADGCVDEFEKEAILKALMNKGISNEVADMLISHSWFRYGPIEELWRIWEELAIATLAPLSSDERNALIDEVLDLCYAVARASGGILGFGRISVSESELIARVTASLKSMSSTRI